MEILKPRDLRIKTPEELGRILEVEKTRLKELSFKLAGAQVKSFHEIEFTKRNIARILTIIKSQGVNHKT